MKRYIIAQNSIRTTYSFRYAYIKKLLKEGSVTIIAPNDDVAALKKLSDLGVNIKSVPKFGTTILSKIIAVFWMNYYILSERRKNSVFICHFLVTFLICFPSLIPFNKRCVVYVEGLGSLFSKHTVFRFFLRFLLRRKNIVRLFCNEDERQILGYSSDKVTGGIGVDLNRFYKNNAEKQKNHHTIIFYMLVG